MIKIGVHLQGDQELGLPLYQAIPAKSTTNIGSQKGVGLDIHNYVDDESFKQWALIHSYSSNNVVVIRDVLSTPVVDGDMKESSIELSNDIEDLILIKSLSIHNPK